MTKGTRIDSFILLYLIASGTISLLIFNNQIVIAGSALTFFLGISLVLSFFRKNPAGTFTMAIFLFAPFLAFLRQYVISYNGTSIILLTGLLLWLLKDKGKALMNTLSDKRIIGIFSFVAIFIIYGLFTGTSLDKFMKFVETILAILLFSLVLSDLSFVKKYLAYFIFSSTLIVLSLLQHIDSRFIFESNDEVFKADPSAYSIGLVLVAFFLLEENGQWVFTRISRNVNLIRYTLLILVITLLFLTTSRIGFFTLIGSYMIFMPVSRVGIKRMIPLIIVIFLSVVIISNSRYAEVSEKWFNKTFKNEQGIAGASTGRYDQWKMAAFYIAKDDPLKVLFGYNPGKGPEFSRKYSTLVKVIPSMKGGGYVLHSLYLIILVEFGLVPFIILVFFLLKQYRKVFKIYKMYNFSIPLLVLTGYMIYIGSNSGLGIIPAMFISLFLLKPEQLNNSVSVEDIQQVT